MRSDRPIPLELAVALVDVLVELQRLAVELDPEPRSGRHGDRAVDELDLLRAQIVREEGEELLVAELGTGQRREHLTGRDRCDPEIRERVLADRDSGRLTHHRGGVKGYE